MRMLGSTKEKERKRKEKDLDERTRKK